MPVKRGWSLMVAGLVALPVTVVDLMADPGHSFAAVYAVLPLVAAINGSMLSVVLACLGGLALTVVMSWHNDDLWHLNAVGGILAVLGATAVAMWAHQTRLAREHTLRQVVRVADAAQHALLPEPAARVGPFAVAASYAAAADEAQIGGDFYKVIPTGFGVRGVIGDVRGHGLGVVRTTAMAIAVFREAAHEERDLAGIAERMDRSLERDAGLEGFATVLLFGASDAGAWTALSFGHPRPLLRTADGAVREVELPGGVPLGTGLPVPGPAPVPTRVPLADGDELMLVTDGVLEARDGNGEFFPLARRYAAAPRGGDPAEVLAAVRRDLAAWAPRIGDDSALVLLRYAPDGS